MTGEQTTYLRGNTTNEGVFRGQRGASFLHETGWRRWKKMGDIIKHWGVYTNILRDQIHYLCDESTQGIFFPMGDQIFFDGEMM